ncbi:MAG: ATP-grasp domain-containing protein, partial [Elusimicrobiales bacterium]|nr:ATP-grasp domain-containing protein [Elusimicrobiales bacterium]
YDGKGVKLIENKKDLEKAIKDDFIIEEKVDILKEISVICARSKNGEIKLYQPCEMIFYKKANICDMVIAPAQVSKKISEHAKEIAYEVVKNISDVGIFAIEMFLSKNQKIYVNEIAPRPHNSGHYTIEASSTSQFEQHIRAVVGLPLGDTKQLFSAVMVNLIGNKKSKGIPSIIGLNKALRIKNLSFHFYGKNEIRPFRKMGHFTIIDKDIKKALSKAKKIKKILKLKGE